MQNRGPTILQMESSAMVSFRSSTASTYWTMRKSISLLLAGLISANSPVFAELPVEIRSTDVTLVQQGLLKGTVLNTSAQPVIGVPVHILHGEAIVASAVSDEEGQFSISGLRNGSHIIQVGSVQQPVRFWETTTAPPASTSHMAIVVDEEIVRGQQGFQPGNTVAGTISSNLGMILLIGGGIGIVLGTTMSADNYSPKAPASP